MTPHEFFGSVPPPIALSVRAHDRVGHRRTDEAWLAETWADPATRVLPLARGRFPVTDPVTGSGTGSVTGSGTAEGTSVAWTSPGEAPEGQRVFLGEEEGVAHFAVLIVEPDQEHAAGWADLRNVGQSLSAAEAGLVVHAVALAEWHHAHRFCPRCGGALAAASAGHVLTCTGCGRQQFPRTDPAVIMLVHRGARCLLGHSQRFPTATMYSTLAGFVEPGESLEEAVAREVLEESGVVVGRVAYHSSQPWPFPGNIMLGFHAEALTEAITLDADELHDARWFTRAELRDHAAHGFSLPRRDSIARRLIDDWMEAT